MNKQKRHNVMVIDDHPIVRKGLATLLAQQPDMQICCEAGSAEDALELLKRHVPDLALVDLTLTGMSGLELLRRLSADYPALPVLVISMHDEKIYARRALQAGARGYIMKQEASDTLVFAARQILDGRIYLSENQSTCMANGSAPTGQIQVGASMTSLTIVEFEVFQLIAEGYSINEIGLRLKRSIKTIESHRTNIRRKLGFNSSHELGHFAAQWQLEHHGF